MIDSLFELFLIKTTGLSLLILLLLLLRPILLNKLNAKVAYVLWAVLPVFLIIPGSWFESAVDSPVMTFFPDSVSLLPLIMPQKSTANSFVEMAILSIWAMGSIISLAVYLYRYQKLSTSLSPLDYQLPLNQLTHDSRFNPHAVQISKTDLVNVPAVFGFFNAYLILPKDFNQQPEVRQLMILRHEFYHLARRDHQVNILRAIIKSLFWFNPLIYWADKTVEADQELSCDLGVLKNSPQKERRFYAETLVASIVNGRQEKNYLVSQWKYPSLIKQRVHMLKNINQKKWHSWVAAGLALTSIWAANQVVAGEKSEDKAEILPSHVVEPRYPRDAAMEGIGGYVRFQLNVDSSGQPYDIQVVESEPKGVFEQEATKAIEQWKFKPMLVNGKAQAQYDMRYTMEFKIAE